MRSNHLRMICARSLANLLRHAGSAFSAAAMASSASFVSRLATDAITSLVAGFETVNEDWEPTHLPSINASSLKRLASFS